jgi:uncharacterized Zn-binding protein involved in type VI secretion
MPKAARKDDTTLGQTTGEHHGHYDSEGDPIHGSCQLSGIISGGSPNVFINGKPAAMLGGAIQETDCCGPGTGSLTHGSSTVFINGNPAIRMGDSVTPHNGSASVNAGSANVFIGG